MTAPRGLAFSFHSFHFNEKGILMVDSSERRQFLKSTGRLAAATVVLNTLPASIRAALGASPAGETGTIADVKHVIVLMQENRSFDHYFGMLNGVRGFGDTQPAPLPNGKNVFFQPSDSNTTSTVQKPVLPFHLDIANTAARYWGLCHSWKETQHVWRNWDAWVPKKTNVTMGYLARQDIPFHYALADAYTICDAYHCSMFHDTVRNRSFLFSGKCTSDAEFLNTPLFSPVQSLLPIADATSSDVNLDENTRIANAPNWETYAEVLQKAGVSWKVYQEFDNYGDNGLQYFRNFRVDQNGNRLNGKNNEPAELNELYKKGRAYIGDTATYDAMNSSGDALIAEFRNNVECGRLPMVSWIVPPMKVCEHPLVSSTDQGEVFLSNLLQALASCPQTLSNTVIFLNYDENDGYFDHMPPPVPPFTKGADLPVVPGKSNIRYGGDEEIWTTGQFGPQAVGLGPRVPMLVISPWSRGGKVCSELFDHTSVIRFMESWLVTQINPVSQQKFLVDEVRCTQISAWRRAICGDLQSAFDFKTPSGSLQDMSEFGPQSPPYVDNRALPAPVPPLEPIFPEFDTTQRRACPLAYDFSLNVTYSLDGKAPQFELNNCDGPLGVALIGYRAPGTEKQEAYHYAVGPKTSMCWDSDDAGNSSNAPMKSSAAWRFHGPNGFLAEFSASAPTEPGPQGVYNITCKMDPIHQFVMLMITNHDVAEATFSLFREVPANPTKILTVSPGGDPWSELVFVDKSGWYDFAVVATFLGANYRWHFAGNVGGAVNGLTFPPRAEASTHSSNPSSENSNAELADGQKKELQKKIRDLELAKDDAAVVGAALGIVPVVLDILRSAAVVALPISLALANLLFRGGSLIPAGLEAVSQSLRGILPALLSTLQSVVNFVSSAVKSVVDYLIDLPKRIFRFFGWW